MKLTRWQLSTTTRLVYTIIRNNTFFVAEEDNKLKENIYDEDDTTERMRSEDLDQDEAKYSPEEKSIVDKSDMDRTPTPSEESEDDEGKKEKHKLKKELYLT